MRSRDVYWWTPQEAVGRLASARRVSADCAEFEPSMVNADLPYITYWHGDHRISITKSLRTSFQASELKHDVKM